MSWLYKKLKSLFKAHRAHRGFTSVERGVLLCLLSGQTRDYEALRSQVIQSTAIRRLVRGSSFDAKIEYVTDSRTLIETQLTIESPSVQLTDLISSRTLLFSTKVIPGGFLYGLLGSTKDGSDWPNEWLISESELVSNSTRFNKWLSFTGSHSNSYDSVRLNKLLVYLRLDRSVDGSRIRTAQGASKSQIEKCESRVGSKLPDVLKEIFTITNSVSVVASRPISLLGSEEVDYIDGDGKYLGLLPLQEDGWIVLVNDRGVVKDDCYLWNGELIPIGKMDRFLAYLIRFGKIPLPFETREPESLP